MYFASSRGLLLSLSATIVLHSCQYTPIFSACSGTRDYNITFQFEWTKNLDPDQPTEPIPPVGFTTIRCAAHNENYQLWKKGVKPSLAIAQLVDQKNPSAEKLLEDIDSAKNPNVFNQSISDEQVHEPTEQVTLTLTVNGDKQFTKISCISLITPSPGWFVGLSSFETCQDSGRFVETSTRALAAWTSGIYEDFEYVADEYTKNDPVLPVTQLLGKLGTYGDLELTDRSFVEEPSESMSSCFPAGELVALPDGSQLPVERLSIGQLVASSDRYTSSQIFMHSHAAPHALTRFVRIFFRDAGEVSSLRVSPGHYVYRLAVDEYPQLVAASKIVAGDRLLGADRLPRRVERVSSVIARGLFNPQSLDGDLIVSGVRVSAFTTAVDPEVAHSVLVPFRFLYRIGLYRFVDMFSNHVLSGRWNEALSQLLPGGR